MVVARHLDRSRGIAPGTGHNRAQEQTTSHPEALFSSCCFGDMLPCKEFPCRAVGLALRRTFGIACSPRFPALPYRMLDSPAGEYDLATWSLSCASRCGPA